MERRAQDVADLEHAAARKFPLWANVRYPGRYFGRDLCVALHCTNVLLTQRIARISGSNCLPGAQMLWSIGIFCTQKLYKT